MTTLIIYYFCGSLFTLAISRNAILSQTIASDKIKYALNTALFWPVLIALSVFAEIVESLIHGDYKW